MRIETTIAGTPEGIRSISPIVDELAATHHLPADVVADVHVVLDEVLNNIITHGYSGDRAHVIRVRFMLEPRALTIEIEDDGKPFNPLTVPPPDRSTSLRDRRVGGLGVHFVRSLMHDVKYSFANNLNRLVLTKNLVGRTGGDAS
jgi:serine/threonine-protein kinase RsbW